MVDPNRKINRLTDKDIEFLEECEEEFSLRYTKEDDEFMAYCSKPLADPPIVENWNCNGGNRNDGGGARHYNRGGSRHRNWHGNRGGYGHGGDVGRGSGGGGGHIRNYRYRSGGRGVSNGNDTRYPNNRPSFKQHDNSCHSSSDNPPPMTIRKDYSNFVAASNDV